MKRFRLTTTNILTGAEGNILVSRVFDDGASAARVEDVYLNYDVEPSIVRLTLYALGIAAAFAIPQWLILYRSTTGAGLAEYVVVGVAALALGCLTTFKDLLKLK